jgi:ADP-heptose:LPS heptosyltransferase
VLGRPILAINIGGKLPVQDWGDANWRVALRDIRAKFPQAAIVCVGSADEWARSDRLAQNLAGPFLNLCGTLTPRETAAVFDRSALFLGHDSGPMHLAASRQRRCVALFGSNNPPRIWHPYGLGHIVFHDQGGIAGIRPEAVVDAVDQLLRAAE